MRNPPLAKRLIIGSPQFKSYRKKGSGCTGLAVSVCRVERGLFHRGHGRIGKTVAGIFQHVDCSNLPPSVDGKPQEHGSLDPPSPGQRRIGGQFTVDKGRRIGQTKTGFQGQAFPALGITSKVSIS